MAVISDLADTLIDTPRAIGLSAVQIGQPIRVFVLRGGGGLRVFINPVVSWASAINHIMGEECMSYPWLGPVKVARPSSIDLTNYNIDGDEITTRMDGMTARVALHELDHCNGITIDQIRRKR
jgi:peptide deformylase